MPMVESKLMTDALLALLRESCEGPPDPKSTWFADNAIGSGLIGVLNRIDASTASLSPVPDGKSIAAHANHAKVHLLACAAWINGDKSATDWIASFSPQVVTAEEWVATRNSIYSAWQAMEAAIQQKNAWSEPEYCCAIGSIAHVAYHLGALKQILKVLDKS